MSEVLKKIMSRNEAQKFRKKQITQGKKVGFTSGTFDLLHAGHVDYLEKAKKNCDCLIVAINSDQSVKTYKDPSRPIVTEKDRAQVIAALSSVDVVFIFDETNNNSNIELLEPDIYFKAGDYTKEQLSSAPLVEKYGGAIEIIPFVAGFSSSNIIDQILLRYSPGFNFKVTEVAYEKRPAVFFDRDGTLIELVDYLSNPKQVKFFSESLAPLKKLSDAGFRLVIVTNQPGIGLGYFTKEDFYKVNLEIFKEASKLGVLFDRVYYSPYGKADKTNCRKPSTGMVERAVEDLNLDLENSFVIGDTTTDMQLAKNAGIYGILVSTGHAGKDKLYAAEPDYIANSLSESVEHILSKIK